MMERDLYSPIGNYLFEGGLNVFVEFPVGKWPPRRIDVLGVNWSQGLVISVEAKIGNWKAAFEQALSRKFFSDRTYIAFPEDYARYVEKKYQKELIQARIGLLSINGDCECFIPAIESDLLNEKRKKRILEKAVKMINEG